MEQVNLEKDLSAEKLPRTREGTLIENFEFEEDPENVLEQLSDDELAERVETILKERIQDGNKEAIFQLGQLYFEQENYDKAREQFQSAVDCGGRDYQAKYQLSVMLYDGLGGPQDCKKALEYMLDVANSKSILSKHLIHAAQYNVGRAYFQGYGVRQSDEEAERWWVLASDDGNPNASVKAQTALGFFYSRPDTLDLKKAFFFHSEACGNCSLESQGALGVMYQNGLGCKKNPDAACECLREAANRGNVYAMGNLVAYYYKLKLFTKTADLAARVAMLDDVEQIARETECLPGYVAKGLALGCFFYARCLHLGHGVKINKEQAKTYYSKSYGFDADTCAHLQNVTQHGEI
ncbi:unnamed protein product [Owenia fusiformis]|uniref:LRP2-binding protein n=1 Tax=Owenia fusiformis TaxID=6347 RepID=A0A8S4NSG1_OWEFU|nr:unnamed protein product [Owenia fusiformis]